LIQVYLHYIKNDTKKSTAFSQPLIEFLPFSGKMEKRPHIRQTQPLVECNFIGSALCLASLWGGSAVGGVEGIIK
jgi:hypothetical protein